MKKIFFAWLLTFAIPGFASHIVGGEFELLHILDSQYQFNMILYFDDINGEPTAVDYNVIITFFRKSDNALMMQFSMPLTSRTRVQYSQPACTSSFLETDRLYYTQLITLSADVFNDPGGYYASWQRCCRNYNITNVYSEDPNNGGTITAGQTFYLEFPPVVKNGVSFINSSPSLFPPLSDYGCPGRPYYVNFAGVDADGDSIVYSMTTPLNTTSSVPLPTPSPAPYPDVTWRPGYSLNNIIGGSPDLRISSVGMLTCTPMKDGLFVFAVKAEEYRDGVKIGETRRDFQLLVVNGCQPDKAPQIVGKEITDQSFSYSGTMAISFADTVKNGNRCIVVQVSDPDSQDPLHNYTQNISIRTVALNKNAKDLGNILPSVTKATLTNGSTADFDICFLPCKVNGPYVIGVVAYDDACSLPMSDTLKITVNENIPPDTNPYFLPLKHVTDTLHEGDIRTWSFTAKDDDGDSLILTVVPEGFSLPQAGMAYNITSQEAGQVSGTLDWSALCKNVDFSKQKNFVVNILVDDVNGCNTTHYDTANYNLTVMLPDIRAQAKIYDETGTNDITSSTINTNLGHIGFTVLGNDVNSATDTPLNLTLFSATGTTTPTGYIFDPAQGIHSVQSKFSWDTDCSIFSNSNFDNQYTFKFLVLNPHCINPVTDTAMINVDIKDIESTDKYFLPPNVITTYPDHCNDFFAIDGFESEPECNGHPRNPVQAPIDNCTNKFERVRIYDRWGKLVYESNDRKFRWYAATESAGVYYYIIYFTHGQYKSPITVIH